MIHLSSHLLALVAIGGLFWLTGQPLARRSGCGRLDSLLLGICLGLGVWIGFLFLLASLRLLTGGAILAGVVAALGAGGWFAFARRRSLGSQPAALPRRLRASPPPAGWPERLAELLLLAVLAVVGVVLFLQAMRPNVSWDANVYHLTVPRLFLENRGFLRIPFNVYSNWPLNVELLFTLAILLKGYVLAKLVHFGFALLTGVATYRLAAGTSRRAAGTSRRWVGLLAVSLLFANPVVLYEARLAYVDLAYAFFFAIAFGLLGRALDHACGSPEARRLLLLAGVAGGLVAGVKLSGFFAPLCLLLLLLVERRRSLATALLGEVPWLLGTAILLVVPWVIKSLWLTGNPVYPLLYSIFGGPEWSTELARLHQEWQRSIGMGRGVVDYLLLPVRVILHGDFGYARFDGRIHPGWIVLLPVALGGLFKGEESRSTRRALLVALLYFLLWSATSQQMRLLIPVLPLLAVAAARSIGYWVGRLRGRRSEELAVAAVTLLAALALLASSAVYLRQTGRLFADLVRHGEALEERVVHPVYRAIDALLPAEARLLLINNNHGFFLERAFIADSFFEASQIRDALLGVESVVEVEGRLREMGISHVLLEHRERGIPFPPALFELLADSERALPIYRSPEGRFTLFELRRL